MAQTTGASSNKAFFTNTDKPSEVFHVQFNPKEFKLDDKASWKASEEHQTHKPILTYEKGEPTTISMDLIFDTTDEGDDVYQKFVIPLRDFLTADVTKTDDSGKEYTRPPYCSFTWNNFTFSGVVEKVSCTFMMFKADGTPLRAKVNVGMKEHGRTETSSQDSQLTLTAFGQVYTGSGANATTATVLPGDTVNSIAYRVNAKPQDIALANNLPDMADLKPGTKLVIPANADLARVLARQSLRHTPAYWKTEHHIDPFKVDAKSGETSYVPSALDEDAPVALDYAVVPGDLASAYVSFGAGGSSGDSAFVLTGKGAEYGDYGESDFTFGERQRQEYGGYAASSAAAGPGGGAEYGEFGPSDAASTQGEGAEYGSYSGSAADAIRNAAKPMEQGEVPDAQDYGGYGDSGAASTQGDGAEYGSYSGSAADSVRDAAKPIEQGDRPDAESYGGYGDSEKASTQGDGASYGTYSGSAASAVDKDATPMAQGSAPSAQTYGGYGSSDGAADPSAAGSTSSDQAAADPSSSGGAAGGTAAGGAAVPGGMTLGEAVKQVKDTADKTDGKNKTK